MDDYGIIFTHSAPKEIEALDNKTLQRILPKIESLAKVPRPTNCRKLQGEENLWRIRVSNYRVIYSIYDNKHIEKRRGQVYTFHRRGEESSGLCLTNDKSWQAGKLVSLKA